MHLKLLVIVLRGAVLDRVLDLGRHTQLHREREQLAVVGHERGGRPRRALALEVDTVAAREPCRAAPLLACVRRARGIAPA